MGMQTAHNLFTSSFKAAIFESKNVKYIASSMIFIVLASILAILLSVVLQTPGSALERKRAIAQREENSVDILIVGNSHAYCTFDPAVMGELTGKRVFNAGMPDQKIDMLYYSLLEILDSQKPETIILEGFAFGRSDSSYQGYVANMDAMTPSLNKLRSCFEIFPDNYEAVRMFISLYRSHNNWRKPAVIKKNLKYMLGLSKEYNKAFNGFYKLESKMSEVTIQKYKDAEDIKFAPIVDEVTSDYFRRIAELCRERNIKLIVAMAPFNDIYLGKINYKDFNNQMEALVKSEKAEYIDYNMLYDEVGLNYDDFEDAFHHAQHMNVWGAEKVSSHMGTYLRE